MQQSESRRSALARRVREGASMQRARGARVAARRRTAVVPVEVEVAHRVVEALCGVAARAQPRRRRERLEVEALCSQVRAGWRGGWGVRESGCGGYNVMARWAISVGLAWACVVRVAPRGPHHRAGAGAVCSRGHVARAMACGRRRRITVVSRVAVEHDEVGAGGGRCGVGALGRVVSRLEGEHLRCVMEGGV